MVVDHQCAVDRIFRACDQFRVMRGEHHLLVVTEQGPRHMRGRHLIQTLGRLVGNDRCGREAQCGSNRQQMALLAIQRGSRLARDRSQIEMREQIADNRLTFAFRHLMFLQRLINRLANGIRLVITIRNLLAANTTDYRFDTFQITLHRRIVCNAICVDAHRAGRRGQRAIQQLQQRGLTGTIQPDYGHTLAFRSDRQRRRLQTDIAILIRVAGLVKRERDITRPFGTLG